MLVVTVIITKRMNHYLIDSPKLQYNMYTNHVQ